MIAENIQLVREKIVKAAIKAGRRPQDIKLVAVSKHFPADLVAEAFAAGQIYFGENYIQEIQTKRPVVPQEVEFHFIGHLQSNKAKIAIETCSMIETVDSLKLGKALNNYLEKQGKKLDVLMQINIGAESSKTGIESDRAEELLSNLNSLPGLRVCGLMTIPPFSPNPESSRPYFRNLRILAEKFAARHLFPSVPNVQLSMGMSGDFHVAIEEGATIVRVGTAIFGNRK